MISFDRSSPPCAAHCARVTLSLSATLLLLLVTPYALSAGQARSWVGGTDGMWATAANWSPAGVPAAGDDVTIGAGCSVTCDVATAQLNSFTLTGGNAKLVFKEATRAVPADCTTVLNAGTVNVLGGAVMTHVPNSQTMAEFKADVEAGWMIDGRVNVNCTDVTVDSTSKINVNELGYYVATVVRYPAAVGPGGCTNSALTAYYSGAGGHGGFGAGGCLYVHSNTENTLGVLSGYVYDESSSPVLPGSSAGNDNRVGFPGGGVVRISATGKATIDGVVSANAGPSTQNLYTGSGGSVWIAAHTVAGSGTISANGGDVSSASGYAYAGGGGRVALTYDAVAQDAADLAAGGVPALKFQAGTRWTHASANRYPFADIGSVYMTDDRFLGEIFDGAKGVQYGQIYCGAWTKWHPASLTVSDSWIRFPDGAGTNLVLSGDVLVSGNFGRLEIGGDDVFLWSSAVNCSVERRERAHRGRLTSKGLPRFSCANLTVTNGAQFAIFPGVTNGVDLADGARIGVTGNFTVGTNAFVLVPCHPTNGAIVRVTAGNLTVAAGGTLSSAGHGFMSFQTEWMQNDSGGLAPGYPCFSRAIVFAPSHGGAGTRYQNQLTSFPYGSLEDPVLPGSPGRNHYARYTGVSGGGVVHVTVSGRVRIDGLVDAAGQKADNGDKGPGAGGTVNLSCTTITGAGIVDATAGNPSAVDIKRAAGGGRIAVHYNREAQAAISEKVAITWKNNSPTRTATTAGTNRGYGGIGTIWFPDAQILGNSFGEGSVMSGEVHLGDWSGWAPAGITADGPDVNVRLVTHGRDFNVGGDLSILNGASLGFGGGTNCCSYPQYYPVFSPAGEGAVVRVAGSVVMNAIAAGRNELHVFAGHGCTVDEEDVGGILQIGRRLELGTNSWIVPHGNPYLGDAVKITVDGNVNIAASGGVDATGYGYSGGVVPAAQWQNNGYGPGGIAGRGRGGGYGGIGGCSVGSTGKFPPPGYGTNAQGVALWTIPTKPGSGSSLTDTGVGGAGGGVVWIDTRRTFTLGGSLIADGIGPDMSGWTSSGAGGAVYVRCGSWKPTETAVVRAKGGATGGMGGGGCVAIWRVRDYDPVATNERTYVSAPAGGYGNTVQKATDGTVYWGDLPAIGFSIMIK